MNNTEIQKQVQAITEQLQQKEQTAKTTQEQIAALRDQYIRIKEEYDVLTGELNAYQKIMEN